ncbi:MAG: (Fe-S)-binding protein [Chloroflexi bacterium]|nr:(Fe-S)-binding protein [Chloroflexota bacterium]
MTYSITVPELSEDVSANIVCYPAKVKDLVAIELPAGRIPDWQERAIAKFGELLKKYRSLQVMMDSCVKCGACADKCQFYLGTGDPKNMPVARAELLRKVYRRYFTLAGRLFGKIVDAHDLDEDMLRDWYTYFYQCSECRRCSVFCPYGIDTAEITMAAREIMASIGIGTKYVTEVIAKVYEQGNNLGIPPLAWKDNCEFLEEELREETGKDIRLPVDEVGAEVLLVMPSADNFANTDTMMGYAKLFYAAGVSWTTSTYCNEAGNFGLFLNFHNLKKVNKRIVDAARELKVKRIIWGECGHAWRAGIMTDALNGPLDFLDTPYPMHICQLTADLIRRGAFKLDRSGNDDMLVTYHDPCNPARAGQLLEEPREIIAATCNNFVEMPAETIRQKTVCCGAGGGLLTDEIMPTRFAGGKIRAEACRSTGATYLATPCAICKAQLPEVMKHYKVDVRVGGVHDLFSKALVL